MSNPYQIPGKSPDGSYMNPQMQQGFSVCQPLAESAQWMQILGWALLIYGVFVSIAVITAIIGIPLAMIGYNLKEAGSKYRMGVPHNPNLQFEASRNLSTVFKISGILFAIWLTLFLLYIGFLFLVIVVGFAGLPR